MNGFIWLFQKFTGKPILHILLFLFAGLGGMGQGLQFYGGLSQNNLHDNQPNEGHHHSAFSQGRGFSLGLELDSLQVDGLKMQISLQFDHYQGHLVARDGGLGGGYTTDAFFEKSLLSLGFYPINLQVFHHLSINAGLVFSALIHESFTGTASGWSMSPSSWTIPLGEKYGHFSTPFQVGIQGQISYDIGLSPKFTLKPRLGFYYGLSQEFDQFPKEVFSRRPFLGLGIVRKF